MAYTRINWENGSVSKNGYVEINGTKYYITMPEYTGNTPVDANNLNKMDKEIKKLSDAYNAKYKDLWQGTWSSGSITVDDISNYMSILVYVDSSYDPIPCYRDGSGNFVGSLVLGNGNNFYNYAKVFRASISENTLTLEYAKELGHNASGNHNAGSNKTVYAIVGLDIMRDPN